MRRYEDELVDGLCEVESALQDEHLKENVESVMHYIRNRMVSDDAIRKECERQMCINKAALKAVSKGV